MDRTTQISRETEPTQHSHRVSFLGRWVPGPMGADGCQAQHNRDSFHPLNATAVISLKVALHRKPFVQILVRVSEVLVFEA